jgi:hypothetical protein
MGLNKVSRLQPGSPVVRYEHSRSGEMIYLDTKKLGRIEVVGYRITGGSSQRKRGAGWEYPHVCMDDHSRLAYAELLADKKATTTICFL